MERKAHNSLNEANFIAAKIVVDKALKKKPRKIVQSGMRAESAVIEYFENYFGDNLNEDTSDEDIMNAVYDLVELRDAVCDAVGLKETENLNHPMARLGFVLKGSPNDTTVRRHPRSKVTSDIIKHDTSYQPVLGGTGRDITKRIPDVEIPPKYRNSKTPIRTLKPSPEQLRIAMAQSAQAKDDSPVLKTGQGTNTQTVRPSEIRAKKRAKRIKQMKKFKMR